MIPLDLNYFSSIGDISPNSITDDKFILDILQNFDAELTILFMKFINDAFLARREALKVS